MAPIKGKGKSRASPPQFASSYSSSPRRYNETHALLLHWQDDDMGVAFELHTLSAVLKDTYSLSSVDIHLIPSKNSYSSVERALDNFKRSYSDPGNLLIVYYTGHGCLDNGKLSMAAYASPKDTYTPVPIIEWYALQVGLERTSSDVLMLLNTCFSASALKSSNSVEGGTTELIAACGFNTTTPGCGEFSFTNALISELRRLATLGRTFSVVDLHQGILAHLAHKNTLHNATSSGGWGNEPAPALQAAPTYVRLHGSTRQPSITLRAFQSFSDDPAAEAKNYQDRLLPRVLNRWAKSMPAIIPTGILNRAAPELPESDLSDYSDEPRGPSLFCQCPSCSASRLQDRV